MAISYETYREPRTLPDCGTYDAYGIHIYDVSESEKCLLKSIPDISDEPELVELIARECNEQEADPIHAEEIIANYLP